MKQCGNGAKFGPHFKNVIKKRAPRPSVKSTSFASNHQQGLRTSSRSWGKSGISLRWHTNSTLRNIAAAQGGMTELARKTHLNRQSLYNILSKKGNPRLDTFGLILKGLGFKLQFPKSIPLKSSR